MVNGKKPKAGVRKAAVKRGDRTLKGLKNGGGHKLTVSASTMKKIRKGQKQTIKRQDRKECV